MKNLDKDQQLLVILMEECAEVTQSASKVLRFGTDQNKEELSKELGDLQAMINLAVGYGLVSTSKLSMYADKKIDKLKIYSNLIE